MSLSFDPSSLSHAYIKEKKKAPKAEKEMSLRRQKTNATMAETQPGAA